MGLPDIQLGEPDQKKGFNCFEADNIKVYVVNSLEPSDGDIYIKLINLLGLKSLDVSGFKVV